MKCDKNGYLSEDMTLKCREELVGKRFLSVRSHGKLKLSKITDWEWRSGVIRAVSPTHRDITSSDLTVSVHFLCIL